MTQELRKLAKRLREGQTHDFTTGYLLDQSAVMDESADAIDALLDRLEKAEKDAERLDWLNSQGYAYGFQDMHEGNRWTIDGPFANVRIAIDESMEASK